MTPNSKPVVAITVVSDVVCPWCFIGKRQLEAALAQWRVAAPGAPEPTVHWLPFQLNPTMSASGMARAEYLQRKFGAADGGGIYGRVLAAARSVGLELQLDRITQQPNTLKAHALVEAAAPAQDALVEALFSAYFIDGRNLSDDDTLRAVARDAGLAPDAIESALGDGAAVQRAAQIDQTLRDQGVSGVPLFMIGRTGQPGRAVSGAQGAPALLAAIESATAD
jgi:predicted DsbA family dithiol-disulfide isomerase